MVFLQITSVFLRGSSCRFNCIKLVKFKKEARDKHWEGRTSPLVIGNASTDCCKRPNHRPSVMVLELQIRLIYMTTDSILMTHLMIVSNVA